MLYTIAEHFRPQSFHKGLITVWRRNCSLVQTWKMESSNFFPGSRMKLSWITLLLPWRAFHILSSRSPSWRVAIQNRQAYDARIRTKSMETLLVLGHIHPGCSDIRVISLYSMRDDSLHQLPAFPFSTEGIPRSCQCVTLDGNLYVLGGEESVDLSECEDGSEAYVFDLVRQTGWKKCSNMPEPRYDFACGVLDGKVYVIGGYYGKRISESLMYDPKEDEWSSLAPMAKKRCGHHVVQIGDEWWVHGGEFEVTGHYKLFSELYQEVYHPGNDKWDYIEQKRCHDSERLFTMKGKPYLMTPLGIYGQQDSSKSNSWTRLQSFPDGHDVDEFEDEYEHGFEVVDTQAVGGEILALLSWAPSGTIVTPGFLYRIKGFGKEKKLIIESELVNCLADHMVYPHSMCPIEH